MSEKRELRATVTVPIWEAFCAKAASERLSPSSVLKRLVKDYLGLDRHGNPIAGPRCRGCDVLFPPDGGSGKYGFCISCREDTMPGEDGPIYVPSLHGPERPQVVDLMAALEASLAAAKKDRKP